jgi:DNA-binding MarR family transcriptional regulator
VPPDADAARDAWSAATALFIGGELRERLDAAAAAAGLPQVGALRALLSLVPGRPVPMRALADCLRCDASYVTGVVDILEDAGYVERRAAPGDRRVKLVCLTPAGHRARDRADHVLTTPPQGLAALTDTEARTLARLLRKVASG